MKIKLDELKDVTRRVLLHSGYDETESAIILDVLLYAQLRGNNQNVIKLIGAGMPKNPDAGEITVVRETKLSALLDGQHNQGMVVLTRAMHIALEKAQAHGFGIVGTHNTNSSTGAIGYYAEKIANEGLIGFVFAGSPEMVSTYGSYQPIFGTNPLAIGLPSAGAPIVLDMATAAIAYYGVVQAKTAGESIPPGLAYDAQGEWTTDPAAALKGAIRPFDNGPKGAGLALMIEALTGPLVAASFAGIGDTAGSWGNLIYVIDPDLLVDRDQFAEQMRQLADSVKNTHKLPGVDEILVPGERGTRQTQAVLAAGEIEIEPNLWAALNAVLE